MPVTKSAQKALRQSRQRRRFNLRSQRQMKDLVKKALVLIEQGKKEQALKALPKLYQAIDKAAKRGIIKKNTASRKKSRLTKALGKIKG